MNPVTQTYQLRASLTYLDQIFADERQLKRKAAKDQAEGDEEDDEDDEAEMKKKAPKAVQVTIKQSVDLSGTGGQKSETGAGGGGNGRADASLLDPLRREEGEAWIGLEYHNAEVRPRRSFPAYVPPVEQVLIASCIHNRVIKPR